MILLAQELQRAGVSFISAKATHRPGGMSGIEIVCETQADVDKASRWAVDSGYAGIARVRLATPEEVAKHKEWEEML